MSAYVLNGRKVRQLHRIILFLACRAGSDEKSSQLYRATWRILNVSCIETKILNYANIIIKTKNLIKKSIYITK